MGKDGKQTKESFSSMGIESSMALSWTELLDAIDEGRIPCHSGRDNLNSVALLTGAYLSASMEKVVSILQNGLLVA